MRGQSWVLEFINTSWPRVVTLTMPCATCGKVCCSDSYLVLSSDVKYDLLVSRSSPIMTLFRSSAASFRNPRFSCTPSRVSSMNPYLARNTLVKYANQDAMDVLFCNAGQIATNSGLLYNRLSSQQYSFLGRSHYLPHLGERGCSGHRWASSQFYVGRSELSIGSKLFMNTWKGRKHTGSCVSTFTQIVKRLRQ